MNAFIRTAFTGLLLSGLLCAQPTITSTTLTSSANPSTFGQSIALTATVTPSTATGSVVFSDGSAVIGTISLSGGSAILNTSSLALGMHAITAAYGGNQNVFGGSTSGILSQTVKSSATLALTSAPNPSTLGQSVTLTATVTPSTATGTITFNDGANPIATVPLSGGTATTSVSTLTAGPHSLSATYSGDSSFGAAVSQPGPALFFTSAVANTILDSTGKGTGFTTRLPGTGGSIAANDPNLTLNTASGTLTWNTVAVDLNGQNNIARGDFIGFPLSAAGVTLNQDFSMSVTFKNLQFSQTYDQIGLFAGTSSSNAFRGGELFTGISTAYTVQNVGGTDTNLQTSTALAPSAGDNVIFTLSRTSGTWAFSVQNLTTPSKSGNIPVTQPTFLNGVSGLIAGVYASNAGNGTTKTETVSSLVFGGGVQNVLLPPTTTTLISSPNPSAIGQPVMLTATVSAAAATGTVTFKDGSTTLGTGALTGGTATFATSWPASGSHPLTASYGGDANFAGSSSSAVNQTVASTIPTTTALAASPNPVTSGLPASLRATVIPSSGSNVATGNVQFFDGTARLGMAPVNGSGVATLSVSTLSTGSHSLSASYGGDSNFSSSTSSPVGETVSPPVVILTGGLPSGQAGVSYSASLSASGGSGGYTWSASGLPAGLSFNASGSITGTPGAPFNGSIFVSVTASGGGSASATLPLTVTSTPIVISGNGNLGDVGTGASVSASFSASGGVPPYRWSLSGAPGISVDSSGNVRGAASAAGTFSPSLTVTDSINGTSSLSLNLAVLGIAGTLPAGTTGSAYSGTVNGVGGAPPYSYSASGLPQGLSFSGGTVSGQAIAPGTYSITVRVTDSKGISAAGSFPFTITGSAPVSLTITTGSVADGAVGQPYSQTLSAAGGSPGYTWSLSGGQLPAGLSLSSSGTILGTPTTAGSASFGVVVSDTSGAEVPGTISIDVQPAPLQITSGASFPAGLAGIPYPAQILSASGGIAPYTFSIKGSLPAGLTLSNGQIAGTPSTAGAFAFSVVATDSAATPATATLGIAGTIRPAAADLVLSTGSASFGLNSGASAVPGAATVAITSSSVFQTLTFSASASVPWLTASGSSSTPGNIAVGLNSAALALASTGSPYSGTVTVTCTSAPCTGNQQTIAVSLTVTSAAPQLTVGSTLVSFAAVTANPIVSTAALGIANSGGGSLAINSVTAAAPWISVSAPPASVAPGPGASVTVTADPAGLKPGYYTSMVTVNSSAGSASVPVTLLVSGASVMALGPGGMQFSMPQGGVVGNSSGSFLVNVSSGTASFSAVVQPGAPWLVGGGSGTASTSPGTVNFSIDPVASAALPVGSYYGTIRVTSSGIVNSPQDFQVILSVTPGGGPTVPNPSPGGMVFITSGAAVPPQTVQLFVSSRTSLGYQAATDGSSWLSLAPSSGFTSASTPAQISITANPAGLQPGVYRGTVSFSLIGSPLRSVNVTLIVTPPTPHSTISQTTGIPHTTGPVCAGAQLVPTATGILSNFSAPASWPTPLTIQLFDTCGIAIGSGQVVATFSNGDPPLPLSVVDSVHGVYSGTWTPRKTSAQMIVSARASNTGYSAVTAQIAGQVAPNAAPVLAANGASGIFNPQVGGGLGPGNIVQIYGTGLAAQTGSPMVLPLPTTINGTQVIIGGITAPLYYVSGGQVNAQIPFELSGGNQYQVIVSANGALTTPQAIQLTPAVPAILQFTSGAVVAQHNDGTLILPSSPAAPGEDVVIYLSGLGATNIPVADGAASPSNPPAMVVDTPVLTLNGTTIPVLFAGLTPTLVGLYQINFQVPTTLAGGNYNLVISQDGTASNQTVLYVGQQ